MIGFRFKIYNPFLADPDEGWKTIADRSWRLTTYKNVELALYRAPGTWLNVGCHYYAKRPYDHAGFSIDLALFGYEFQIVLYDSRHRDIKWDGEG